jgi:hypothetical protein
VSQTGPPAISADALAAARENELPDGVHIKDDQVLFKIGDAYLKCTRKGQDPRFGFYSVSESEWEHGYLSLGVRRIVADESFVRELGLSREQVDKLENLPAAPSPRWADADRGRFTKLLDEWARLRDQANPAKGQEILKQLATYASARRSALDKSLSDRVKIIKETLTPAQLAKINPIPRWNLSTTRPATRP